MEGPDWVLFDCKTQGTKRKRHPVQTTTTKYQVLISKTISYVQIQVIIPLNTTFESHHEKTNILVSDLVRHKPGCTAAEDG